MRKRIITLITHFFLPVLVLAQGPGWQVDLGKYEHRMIVTAVLNVTGAESRDAEDWVAAFINGEIRGVAQPNIFHEPTGRNLIFLQVGSDVPSGESIEFKFYDASTDRILQGAFPETFEANKTLGTVNGPFVISDVVVPPQEGFRMNNFLSPNDDGVNDLLEIKEVEQYIGFSLSIFNASGELLYRSDNYQNNWDGKYNGSPLPAGIYYYRFENPDINVQFKGVISLKDR